MIDILPLHQKKAIRRIRLMRILATCFAAITVLVLVCAVLLLPTLETVRSRTAVLSAYTRELEESGAIINTSDIAALQERTVNLRERLTAKLPESPLVYIDTVTTYQVPGVRVTGYEVSSPEKRTMQVRGVAANREALQRFITILDQDARIATVDSPVTNFVKSTESEFAITLTFTQL